MNQPKNNAKKRNGSALPIVKDFATFAAWIEFTCQYCHTTTAARNADICTMEQMPIKYRIEVMEAKMRAYAAAHPEFCNLCQIDMQPKIHITAE